MFLLKSILIIILLFCIIYYFYQKKNIEYFKVLGTLENLCPQFNLIEINSKDLAKDTTDFKKYYNKDSKTKYYIEEPIQPFPNSNIVGVRLSENYLWVLGKDTSGIFDLKYCKLDNHPTTNLQFKSVFKDEERYTLDSEGTYKPELIIDRFGTSAIGDFCAVFKSSGKGYRINIDDNGGIEEKKEPSFPNINRDFNITLSKKKKPISYNNVKDNLENIDSIDNLLVNKVEFLKDDNIKKNVKKEYSNVYKIKGAFHLKTVNQSKKEFGIINVVDLSSKKPFIKKYLNERNFLVGAYYKISNIENDRLGDKKKDIYTRINDEFGARLENVLIPAFKFNFEDTKDYFDGENKISLYKYFEKEFGSKQEWIYLYNALRNAGMYYPKRFDFPSMEDRVKNILEYDKDIINNNKYQERHKAIINKLEFEDIYNFDKKNKELYANIFTYTEDDKSDKLYNIHLDFESDNTKDLKDINIGDRIYIGLKNITPQKTKLVDYLNRTFYNYELQYIKYSDYNNLEEGKPPKNNFQWTKKEIKNFNDFKKEIINPPDNEYDLHKERLRGLLEIDDKFIDEYYIDYLFELKKNLGLSNQFNMDKFNSIINKKLRKVREICVYNEKENKLKNILGYPFFILYQEKDRQGVTCDKNDITNPKKQRIFLVNNIKLSSKKKINDDPLFINSKNVPSKEKNIEKNIYKNIYTIKPFEVGKGNPSVKINNDLIIEIINSKDFKYPFIKQEFMSYTGFGNAIQFYSENIGGYTDIDSKNICNINLPPPDNCDKKSDLCVGYKIGEVNIDGSAKCEIKAKDVSKKKESDNEQTFLGVVPKSACSAYIIMGDNKYYYKLGKPTSDKNGQKDQYENMYLIRWVNPNNQNENDNYLKRDDEVKEKIILSPLPENGSLEKYTFYLVNNEGDNETMDEYGKYIHFSDKSLKKMLTIKYNIFSPQKLIYTLEPKFNDLNRDDPTKNYLNNKKFYTQKFLLDDSLARNIYVNENMKDETFAKMYSEHKKINNLSAKISPDDPDNVIVDNLDPKEEIELSEKVNEYLKKQNDNINNFDITKLGINNNQLSALEEILNTQKKEVKKRQKKVQKHTGDTKKYMVYNDILQKKDNVKLFDKNLISQGIGDLNLNQEENDERKNSNVNVKKMEDKLFLQNIKKMEQLLKENNYKPTCNVGETVEEFSNLDKYSNNKYNKHLVDKYQKYILGKIDNTNTNLCAKNKDITDSLSKIQELSKSVNYYDNNYKELRLNEELNKDDNLNRDIFKIKNYEQEHRMNKKNKKIKQLNILKCKLKIKDKKEGDDRYNSIISKEDAELLNVYKLSKCEIRDNFNEKIPENIKLDKNLNLNKILINGGCLDYNEDENNLSSKHCMLSNPNQVFEVDKINSKEDLKKYNLGNFAAFDKPFYMIKKRNENKKKIKDGDIELEDDKRDCPLENNSPDISGSPESSCPPDLHKYSCLHKENGNLTLRDCANIKNQQWIYSTSSGSCK